MPGVSEGLSVTRMLRARWPEPGAARERAATSHGFVSPCLWPRLPTASPAGSPASPAAQVAEEPAAPEGQTRVCQQILPTDGTSESVFSQVSLKCGWGEIQGS